MFKKIFIMVLFLLPFFFNVCISQVNVEWFRTYGAGYGKNFVNDFAMDSSGNSYLTGNVSKSSSNSRTAIGTVKYSSNGELQWASNFEGTSQSIADGISLVVDKNENVYVTGICTDNDENYCTIKYNALGEILWVKKYHSGAGSRDEPADIALDKDDNIYVTGYSYYSGISQFFWSTLKYDSSGNLLWISKYEGDLSKIKRSRKITFDSNQNVYVSGFTTEFSNSRDFCTVKYNQNGDQQWISIFNNSDLRDEPTDMTIDNFGNIYVLGQSYNGEGFYTSLVKYDHNGDELWSTSTDSVGKNDSWYFNKIFLKLHDDNIYIATTYTDYCCTIKYNSNGVLQWLSKYKKDIEFAYATGVGVNVDDFGNIYTTGFERFFVNVQPFITIKYNSDGVMLWNRSFNIYNDVELDEGAFVAVDNNNNVYVAGNHDDPFHSNKALYGLLKYSQGVGISNISSEIPDNYSLYQNYPNPFNPNTIITYEIPVSNLVTLKVYDILGNEINTLVNENQNAGKYEVDFDGSDIASGVYYYKLSAGEFTQTKRMLLLK